MLSDVRFHRLGVTSVFPVTGQSASLSRYVAESNWQSKGRGEERTAVTLASSALATVSLICSLCGCITRLCRIFSRSKTFFFRFFYKVSSCCLLLALAVLCSLISTPGANAVQVLVNLHFVLAFPPCQG